MANTGFTVNGIDVSVNTPFISKSYLLDRYPELANTFKTAGLWGWGAAGAGGLGNNTTTPNVSSPVQTVAGGTNWKQVVAGSNFIGAIKTDGSLWMWGGGTYGQLGTGNTTGQSSPVQTVAGGTNWIQVSSGGTYATVGAIKTNGTLWTWGQNNYGQLGTNNTTDTSSPVQTVAAGTNWKFISTGGRAQAAIKTDGTLWMWGQNNYGNLGTNDRTNRSSPIQTVAGGTNWQSVSCGASSMITGAIKSDGTLWTWGLGGYYGALGANNLINYSSPIQTIAGGTNWKQVSAGGYYMGAVKTDGTLWMWGNNNYGNLGDNTTTAKSSPIQTIAGGTNWKQLSSGQQNCAAIKTDGTLWGWGTNANGQLSVNDTTPRSSPVQIYGGGTNWRQVSIGTQNGAAIRDDSADFGIGTL